MSTLITVGVTGTAVGCIYALLAFGYSLVFKASRTINLAMGALMLLGGYVAYEAGPGSWHLTFSLASMTGAVVVCAGGWVAYRLIARPLVGASPDALVVATIGLDLSLRALMAGNHAWADGLEVGSPWTRSTHFIGHRVALSDLWIIAITAVTLLALGAVVRYTSFGLNMRACSEDPEAAQAQGISLRGNLAAVWVIAAGLAAMAGILVGTFPRTLDPSNFIWALRALPAVVLGGMDSLRGAVLGGLIVGWAEAASGLYQPAWLGQGYQLVVPYALMLVVLLTRPQGLLGRPEVSRV